MKGKKSIQDMKIESGLKQKLYTKNQFQYEHAAQIPPDHTDKKNPGYTPEEMNYLKKYGLKDTYTYKNKEGQVGATVSIHPMCVACQARHIMKYKDHSDAIDGKPFKVRCTGVPGALPPGSKQYLEKFMATNNMDKERAELIWRATVDPVAWAELMFGFSDSTIGTENEQYLRWYQKEQLRCSAKRIVLREGRRSGKTFVMALKLLYYIFNYQVPQGRNTEGTEQYGGPAIVVVTPFQAQLINIFNELEKTPKEEFTSHSTSELHSRWVSIYEVSFLPDDIRE
jgi:hypothetical protein